MIAQESGENSNDSVKEKGGHSFSEHKKLRKWLKTDFVMQSIVC